jgi:hypothetical protein
MTSIDGFPFREKGLAPTSKRRRRHGQGNTIRRFGIALLALLLAGQAVHVDAGSDTAAAPLEYAPEYVSDTWGAQRSPYFFSGTVVAIDPGSISIEHRWDRHAPPRSLTMEVLVVKLDANSAFIGFPENRKAVVGDDVHVILDRQDPTLAAEIHDFPGAQVSVRNVADRLTPDEKGKVFFDDFESGDLRQWHLRRGQVNVIDNPDEVLSGTRSLKLVRRDYSDTQAPNFNQEIWTHGFPRMNDVWMQWDMRLHGTSTVRGNNAGAFAILRPFHYNHAEAFAVILVEAENQTFRLAIQWGTRPVGEIVIRQDQTYHMKLHLKRPSAPDAQDGVMETWIDGVADIQAGQQSETRADHYFDRLTMGFMHCGRGTAKAGVMYLDNLWIGIRDPDAPSQ